MPDPLVSVAVITYNHEKFIGECLDSVLSQDYGNMEIVIADDGSTDRSHTILREYEKKYPDKFILRLSAKNQGITRNTNVALYACSGKYIAWLGGDDLMLPGKLKKQVAYMERHPDCRITYHNLEVFDSETQQRLYYFNNPLNSYQGDVSVVIRRGTFNGACSTMVRKDKTPLNGFDVRLPIASDWLFWIETLIGGGEIHYIDRVMGKYRRHSNNVTLRKIESYEDHFNTIAIVISRYPKYTKEGLARMSELFLQMRRWDDAKYVSCVTGSKDVKFNWKAYILLFFYYLSFGRIKI